MPDCNYCDESFADEDAYLQHLHESHDESELSRIDRRRVGEAIDDSGGGLPTGPIILVGLVLFTLAATVYVAFFLGGNGGGTAAGLAGSVQQTPTNVGAVHEHGTIDVTIDGRDLDFSRDAFQNPREYPAFHFEGGNGDVWHVHARGVTLEYAMATLGISVNESAVSYNGQTYVTSDPDTNITVLVNGEPVDPQTYVLDGASAATDAQRGDHIRIAVRTTG